MVALPAYAAYADDPTPPPPASVTDVNRSLEQLQAEAAAIQADVAKATIAYTNALKTAQTAEAAAKKAEAYRGQHQGQVATIERRKLGLVTAQAYQLGIPTVMGTESMLWSLAPVAENLQEIADRQTAIRQLGSTQVSQYKQATAAETAAGTAAGDAASQARGGRQGRRQTASSLRQGGPEQGSQRLDGDGRPDWPTWPARPQLSKQLQTTRNQQALANWQTYLTELSAAKVKAPAGCHDQEPANALRPV